MSGGRRHLPAGAVVGLALIVTCACSTEPERHDPAAHIVRLALAEAGVARGPVAVDVTLAADEPLRADLTIAVGRPGGEPPLPAAFAGGAGRLYGLSASPEGISHRVVWESAGDLPAAAGGEHMLLFAVEPGDASASLLATVDNRDLPPRFDLETAVCNAGGLSVEGVLSEDLDPSLSVVLYARRQRVVLPGPVSATPGSPVRTKVTAPPELIAWAAGDGPSEAYLRLLDRTGEGPATVPFDCQAGGVTEPVVLLAPPPPSMRHAAPLDIRLAGPDGATGTVSIDWTLDGEERPASPDRFRPPPDLHVTLSRAGAALPFAWDTDTDLPGRVVSGIEMRVAFAATGGGRVSVYRYGLRVNNGGLAGHPLIGEICPGAGRGDRFVELSAPPGHSFERIELREIGGNGIEYGALDLSGLRAGASGLVTVCASKSLLDACDRHDAGLDRFFERFAGPVNLVLGETGSSYLHDAVGFGDFDRWNFLGEGSPAPFPPPGGSLQRDVANADSNDNGADFVADRPPTPGSGAYARW